MIPDTLNDSEPRSINSIVMRNLTNFDMLSMKSYCTFTNFSASRESSVCAARNEALESLMERVDYSFQNLQNANDRSKFTGAKIAGIMFRLYGDYTVLEGMGTRYDACRPAWNLISLPSPSIIMKKEVYSMTWQTHWRFMKKVPGWGTPWKDT